MAVASAEFEAGQVFLPERADWLPDLEAELFAFPGGRHDDRCDSISQALCDGDRNMPMEITDEILAMVSRPWRESAVERRLGRDSRRQKEAWLRKAGSGARDDG
jgi:hypothetical protein